MQLETVMVPITDLLAYENNAKIHTEAQIEHIRNSIREFGFNDPVGVWTNNQGRVEIVTGHGSVIAAQAEGMAEVPCNFLDHLTDEQRRAYCHVHNQTQLETGFDVDVLIPDMDNLNCDWENFGFESLCYKPEAGPAGDSGYTYQEQFAVTVICESEETQRVVFERLTEEGYNCKVVVV